MEDFDYVKLVGRGKFVQIYIGKFFYIKPFECGLDFLILTEKTLKKITIKCKDTSRALSLVSQLIESRKRRHLNL